MVGKAGQPVLITVALVPVAAWWSSGWAVAVVVLVVATVFGVAWRRAQGRFRPGGAPPLRSPVRPGAAGQVTLLQFSSPTCGPCRQVRALCADVAAATPGVVHVEVDAAADLAAARAYGVHRVPTLVVVDPAGRPVSRAVGVPRRAELVAAVARVLDRQVA
jgi:thiol-disulfide isomerase/thioredoxin